MSESIRSLTFSPFSNLLSVIAQSARHTPSRPRTVSTGTLSVLYSRSSFRLQGEKSFPPFIRLGRQLVTENEGSFISFALSRLKALGKVSSIPSTLRCGRARSSQARRLRASRAAMSERRRLEAKSLSAPYQRSEPS